MDKAVPLLDDRRDVLRTAACMSKHGHAWVGPKPCSTSGESLFEPSTAHSAPFASSLASSVTLAQASRIVPFVQALAPGRTTTASAPGRFR